MRPVTTHFEQIPVEVVKKIAAQTPETASPGVGVQPAHAGSGTPGRLARRDCRRIKFAS